MSKLLSILSIVLLIGAGALGFLNKQKLDAKSAEIETAKAQAESAQAKADEAEKANKQLQTDIAVEQEKAKAAEEELRQANTRIREIEGKLASLQSEIDQKTAKIAELEQAASSASTSTEQSPDAGKLAELEAQIGELNTQLAAAEEEKKILSAKLEAEQAAAENLREAERMRQSRLMAKSLEGTILAYNPAWNFVVLNIGDRNGVVSNAEFLVTRGSQMVGRVKVTSVEPSTSIADVVPSSMVAGTQIQPGDRVIVPPGS